MLERKERFCLTEVVVRERKRFSVGLCVAGRIGYVDGSVGTCVWMCVGVVLRRLCVVLVCGGVLDCWLFGVCCCGGCGFGVFFGWFGGVCVGEGSQNKLLRRLWLLLGSTMKISASDARIGNLIEYQGKLWRILKKEHVKPGKGGAFAQLEMKALKDGTKLNGRIMNMRNNEYWVNTDMMKPSAVTKVKDELITSIEPSTVSMMPPALLSTMKKEDVFDLLAYLISGADPKHELFNK